MRNSAKYLFGILAAIILVCGCKKDTPSGSSSGGAGVTLSIKVADEDGAPLSGAKVTCGGKSGTTGGDGSVTLTKVKKPTTKFNVKITKEGFFPAFENILYESGSTATFYGSVNMIET